MAIKDLGKLPKRRVSVDEVLGLDNMNDLRAWLEEMKSDAFDAVLIIGLEDGNLTWRTTGMPLSRLIYLLRVVENAELNPNG